MTKVNSAEMRSVDGGYKVRESAYCSICGKKFTIGYNCLSFLQSLYQFRARVQAKELATKCANSHL